VLVFQPGYMTADARHLHVDMRAWTLATAARVPMGASAVGASASAILYVGNFAVGVA
jgi:hypothetical protein